MYGEQMYINWLQDVPHELDIVLDIGSNDGIALKPFKDLGFKNILESLRHCGRWLPA